MYFKRTRCKNCQSSHDEMLEYCPRCGIKNEEHLLFRRTHPMTFVPWYRELMLFLCGFIGLTLFSLIYTIIFKATYEADKDLGNMLINTASYLTIFVLLLVIMFPYFRSLINKFKIPLAYMWAGIGTGALLGFSIIYGIIISFIFPDIGQGGNQTSVSNMVTSFPFISLIIIGIIGPMCEELTYRVGLFTLLRRIHPAFAYIGTAILFGLIHFDFFSSDYLTEFVYLVNYIFAGVCFAFIYEKGGFGASLLAHISNNVYSVIMILLSTYLV